MSSFTWLDYSEQERRKAMEVIDLFREEDTVDELGLGTIRDGFADLFFPGTSTIQTRARYFLFVPWIYLEQERRRTPSHDVADQIRRQQGRLRGALMEGGEEVGMIGYRAGFNVQRLPSSVYWYGLRQWGILRYAGSEDDYHRSLDSFYRRADGAVPVEQGEAQETHAANWDPHLPPLPAELLSDTSFGVSGVEAEYLIDRVTARWPGSLLVRLLQARKPIAEECRFAWDHEGVDRFGGEMAERLRHARNFSRIMHGAALLYNLILAEQAPRTRLKLARSAGRCCASLTPMGASRAWRIYACSIRRHFWHARTIPFDTSACNSTSSWSAMNWWV